MVPSALKCYRKASRKEEKVVLFISTGVDQKLHGKMKKNMSLRCKGRGGGGVPARRSLTTRSNKKKENSASKPYRQEK
jgi:hypothetical protein